MWAFQWDFLKSCPLLRAKSFLPKSSWTTIERFCHISQCSLINKGGVKKEFFKKRTLCHCAAPEHRASTLSRACRKHEAAPPCLTEVRHVYRPSAKQQQQRLSAALLKVACGLSFCSSVVPSSERSNERSVYASRPAPGVNVSTRSHSSAWDVLHSLLIFFFLPVSLSLFCFWIVGLSRTLKGTLKDPVL